MLTDSVMARVVWPLLASLAGSITALSFRPYKQMERLDICLSIAVGVFFAYFVGPIVVSQITTSQDVHMQGAAYYILASGSNVLVPLFIRKVRGLLGVTEDGSKADV